MVINTKQNRLLKRITGKAFGFKVSLFNRQSFFKMLSENRELTLNEIKVTKVLEPGDFFDNISDEVLTLTSFRTE